MREKTFLRTVIIASLVASAMCLLPLMSARAISAESATLLVRGYNLIEFSPWGIFPIVAPLLIPLILISHLSERIQRVLLATLLASNALCYVSSFLAARTWLEAINVEHIAYHFGTALYPLAFVTTLALAALPSHIVQKITQTKIRKLRL